MCVCGVGGHSFYSAMGEPVVCNKKYIETCLFKSEREREREKRLITVLIAVIALLCVCGNEGDYC